MDGGRKPKFFSRYLAKILVLRSAMFSQILASVSSRRNSKFLFNQAMRQVVGLFRIRPLTVVALAQF